MQLLDDAELISAYASQRSEDAFAVLVERHLPLVYSSALRQVRDPHLAQEVTQAVFILLARKAGQLNKNTILAGWLCRTARFAACNVLKAQNRRQHHETEAHMESLLQGHTTDAWPQIEPLLDDAVAQLGETDRNAVVLRYYQQKPLEEVGKVLGVSADTAQKRVTRALERLRAIFAKRGVTLTITTIAAAVAANAVQAAPAGLAFTIKAASLAAAGTGTITLVQLMTNLKLALTALAVAGTATAFVVQHREQTRLNQENDALRQNLQQLATDNESFSNRLATAATPKSMTADQMNELLKLRGEVGALRKQVGGMEQLRQENLQLQASLRTRVAFTPAIDPQVAQHQVTIQQMNLAKQGMLGFIMYANDHAMQIPTNFTQTASYFNDGTDQYETNFDIVYQGPVNDIATPSDTIILREKQGRQTPDGNWVKVYGFADGHAEVHSERDGNFDKWEKQRIIPPPNQ